MQLGGRSALVEAASVFRSCFRGGDILGRLGGDEFVMLLFPGRHEIDRDNVLQRLKNGLAERNAAPHRAFDFSVSVGFARLTAGESLGDLMARADRDMSGGTGKETATPYRSSSPPAKLLSGA